MHIHYQRRWGISTMRKWRCEQRFDTPAIDAPVSDALAGREREGRFRERVQMSEAIPGNLAGTKLPLLAHLPQPDFDWLPLVGMGGSETTQVRCRREMRPASLHHKIADQGSNGSIAFAHHADVLRQTIPGGIEQVLAVGKPAAPRRAARNIRCQVARLAIREGKYKHISAAPAWVAPLARNKGEAFPIGRPGERTGLSCQVCKLAYASATGRNNAYLPAIPVCIVRASGVIQGDLLAIWRPGIFPDGKPIGRHRFGDIEARSNRP